MKNFLSVVMISLFGVLALAASDYSKLSSRDPLQGVVGRFSTRWGDSNISTGRTELWAGQLNKEVQSLTESELVAFNVKQANRIVRQYSGEALPASQKFTSGVSKLSNAAVNAVVSDLMLSNAYSSEYEEGHEDFRKKL